MTIQNLGNLTIRINGPEVEEYAQSEFSLENLPYDAAVSFHFITKINPDLTAELLDNKSPYMIIAHNTGEDLSTREVDSFDITVPEDGYYEITTLVFPTISFVENALGFIPGSPVQSNINTNIVAADIIDSKVILKILTHTLDLDSLAKHIWADWECISLPEVLTMLELSELKGYFTADELTVKKYTLSAFVYDTLFACYISKANDLLNKYLGDEGFCGSSSLCNDNLRKYKSEIQVRDYLWMAINVIKYCVQNCQYLKALKILGCTSTCAGICSDVKLTKSNTNTYRGCGCGKRN